MSSGGVVNRRMWPRSLVLRPPMAAAGADVNVAVLTTVAAHASIGPSWLPLLDENGDPILDENSDPIYVPGDVSAKSTPIVVAHSGAAQAGAVSARSVSLVVLTTAGAAVVASTSVELPTSAEVTMLIVSRVAVGAIQ